MCSSDSILNDSILPAPPPGEPLPILHDRQYRVRAYRLHRDRIVILGAVRDQKPPGLYLRADPEPITIHHMQASLEHMQVSLEVAFPSLENLDAVVHFESHPRDECASITDHYRSPVGLSIARGFTHELRKLFGGPRGCAHTSALLQAMAPIAVQRFWSMRAADAALTGAHEPMLDPRRDDDPMRRPSIDTCDVWVEDGPAVAARGRRGGRAGAVWLRPRLAKLGIAIPDGHEPTTTDHGHPRRYSWVI